MITDFGHTAIFVKDVDVALDFYSKLGINESFRLNHPDGSLFLVYLHISGDRFLEIFPNGPEPMEPFKRVQSFHHMCLVTDDIEGMVEQLRSAGAPIDREVSVGLDHNKQAWTHDPDGNPIELMQLNPISPQARIARGESPGM
jgi:catechol 2,3-dioxygenase-like lactoylglutathione lyase family enzyme